MKRKYLSEYCETQRTDERGRVTRVYEYTGAAYDFQNRPAAQKARKHLPMLCVAGWLSFAAALFPDSLAGKTAYVALPFAFAALPWGIFTSGVWRLRFRKPPLEHMHADAMQNKIAGGALFSLILSGLTLLGEGIAALCLPERLRPGDTVFALGAAAFALAAFLALRLRSSVKMFIRVQERVE